MAKKSTVPVTERALVQRVNRYLAEKSEMLRKWRSGQHVGDYYLIDWTKHVVIKERVELESFARDLGILQPYESLEDK